MQGLITEFLRQLNDVWAKREARRLATAREKYTKQLHNLRRQLDQQTPYEEVMQRDKLVRLQRDVKNLRLSMVSSSRRVHFPIGGQRARDTATQGLDRVYERAFELAARPSKQHGGGALLEGGQAAPSQLVEACLVTVEDVSQQLAACKTENDHLRRELAEASQAAAAVAHHTHSGAAGGARVVADRADGLVVAAARRVKDRAVEFSRRAARLDAEDADYAILLMRAHSAMLEDIEEILLELQEQMRALVESAHDAV